MVNEFFDKEEQELLFDALNYYSSRCKTNATRQLQGFGNAKELAKREKWLEKHHRVEELINKVAQDCN